MGFNIFFKGPEERLKEVFLKLSGLQLSLDKEDFELDGTHETVPIVPALSNPVEYSLQGGQIRGLDFVAGPFFPIGEDCVLTITLRSRAFSSMNELAFRDFLGDFWDVLGPCSLEVGLYGAPHAFWISEFLKARTAGLTHEFFGKWAWPLMMIDGVDELSSIMPNTKRQMIDWEKFDNGRFGACV
jgi:hypothetical protein